MTSVAEGSNTSTYNYSRLGDRLQQTVNGQTTKYTLDINSGLTQVLDDGTNTYTYGVDRISQQNGSAAEYFLGDVLGSVRQLTDASDAITQSKSYDPYGKVISIVGSSTSIFAFTGEQADQTGLTYLRSRMYDPIAGRFLTKDSWQGDYNKPLSQNAWLYVEGNPVDYVDPTGYIKEDRQEAIDALAIYQRLQSQYGISLDYFTMGYYGYDDGVLKGRIPLVPYKTLPTTPTPIACRDTPFGWIWHESQWTIEDLKAIDAGAAIVSGGIHNLGGNYNSLIGSITIIPKKGEGSITHMGSTAEPGIINWRVPDYNGEQYRVSTMVHETGHELTYNIHATMTYFMNELGTMCYGNFTIDYGLPHCYYEPSTQSPNYSVGPNGGNEHDPYANMPSRYATQGNWEDFAETFRVVVANAYGSGPFGREANLVYTDRRYSYNIGKRADVMKSIINGSWR